MEIDEAIIRLLGGTILDDNNIVWKIIDNKLTGKRAVFTKDYRFCWLEDTTEDNIKTWYHSKNLNHNEIFIRKE